MEYPVVIAVVARTSYLSLAVVLVALQVWFAIAGFASAATWTEAIASVEMKAKDYHQRATALGFPVHAGTAVNELDLPIHQCSILGRMLGKDALTKHLEKDYPTVSKTGAEFRYAAISLGNWAGVASSLLKLDEARRVRSWNLDCVGQHGIPTSAYIQESNDAAFFDVVDGKLLRILGDVTEGFADRLRAALRQNPGVQEVALGSGGGLVGEAMVAGRLIRARGLRTTLWNNCYSACSLVFFGGTTRTIWSPYPKLGFHMVSLDGIAVPPTHFAYSEIAKYAVEMNVDQATVIAAMMSASPREMRYLHGEQMCNSRIATWIQRACGW